MVKKIFYSVSIVVLCSFIGYSARASSQEQEIDTAISLSTGRVLKVSEFLMTSVFQNQSDMGWNRESDNAEKLMCCENHMSLNVVHSDLHVALFLQKSEFGKIAEYSKEGVTAIIKTMEEKNIRECFLTGFKHGAELALSIASELKNERPSLKANQIKAVIFSLPLQREEYSGLSWDRTEKLNEKIGKRNILHFENRSWFSLFSSPSPIKIGIPIVVMRTERPFFGLGPSNEGFTRDGVERAFEYARTNYETSPDTNLDLIGIPSSIGRRGLFS